MAITFNELFSKYYHDVYQFLFYLVKNKELAEDLVQEVFIRVLKSYEAFEGKSSEKTWLFSIAKNVAIDSYRKQKGWKGKLFDRFDWQTVQIKDQHPLPEEFALRNDEYRQLYHALDYCSVDQKLVVVMRFIQDLSITETAEALGWTESKVKTTQHRAIKVLKKKLEEQMAKEGNR